MRTRGLLLTGVAVVGIASIAADTAMSPADENVIADTDSRPRAVGTVADRSSGFAVHVRGRLLVAGSSGTREISVAVGPDGTTIIGERQIALPGLAQAPSYAPDGKRFAYVIPSGTTTDLHMAVVNGSSASEPLTSTRNVRETGPAWSPDGKYVAYERTDESGKTDIWLVDVESGESRPAIAGPDMYLSPAWAPGTSQFAYVSRSRRTGESDLYAYDINTGQTTQLTSTSGRSESQPAYAPDGVTLAHTITNDAQTAESGAGEGPVYSDGIRILEPSEKPGNVDVPGTFLFIGWLSPTSLAVVDASAPNQIKAVAIEEPDQVTTLWTANAASSFDWQAS